MSWPPHPDDQWVDVTSFNATGEETRFLAVSGVDVAIARAKACYLAGQIDAEEFERRVDQAIAETVA